MFRTVGHLGATLPIHRVLSLLPTARFRVGGRAFAPIIHECCRNVAYSTNKNTPDDSLRDKLLNLALDKYVHQEGWSARAVECAAKELGLSPSICSIVKQSPKIVSLKEKAFMLEGESVETTEEQTAGSIPEALVLHFIERCNDSLVTNLETMDTTLLRTPQKIRLACVERLKLVAPFIERYDEALSVVASSPRASLKSLNKLFATADDMWHFAGDVSVDSNWYTKRLILSGVYASTELFWTQAKTEGTDEIPVAVLDFLDRRLADIAAFGKLRSQAEAGMWNMVSFLKGIAQPMKRD